MGDATELSSLSLLLSSSAQLIDADLYIGNFAVSLFTMSFGRFSCTSGNKPRTDAEEQVCFPGLEFFSAEKNTI